MNDVLSEIEKLYLSEIPAALNAATFDGQLYAAFVGYFGWGAGPEDYAEHGRCIYALPISYLQEVKADAEDADEQSYMAYSWGEFLGNCNNITIESELLSNALLRWYTHQQADDANASNGEFLRQIGGAMAAACRQINKQTWPSDRFTDDFVVFTGCMEQEVCEHGLAECAPPEWIAAKKKLGMFGESYPLE